MAALNEEIIEEALEQEMYNFSYGGKMKQQIWTVYE